MAKKRKVNSGYLRKHWGDGTPITYKGKKYRVGKMSYGDYFLEPTSWKGGETKGHSPKTLWLQKTKENPYFYEVE